MNAYSLSIRRFGSYAVLIEWPRKVDRAILNDILRYKNILEGQLNSSQWEFVPSYNSLTLIKNAELTDFESLCTKLREWYSDIGLPSNTERFLWRLPVCYDAEFGVDLEDSSQKMGMSVDQLIAMHTEPQYLVYGIGFLPGFMYLGGLPASLEIPRRASPRLTVAKGAVGIAAQQTGIYPQQSPGGWNIIGNCPIPIFSIAKSPPCFVSVGDEIQFYAITKAVHELHRIEGEVGIFKVEKIRLDAQDT